ncbi:MAG: hypothetical protein FWD15_04320 [Alphaproteobacteria bacterium]|nr:hypothetical protein [Alphaproteobacteria bacterium]
MINTSDLYVNSTSAAQGGVPPADIAGATFAMSNNPATERSPEVLAHQRRMDAVKKQVSESGLPPAIAYKLGAYLKQM